MSLILLVAIVTACTSLPFGSTQVCDANAATKCGSDCHCEYDNYCGSATCYSLCDPGWTGTDCQTVCDASAATKCGSDCHCQNYIYCGTATCYSKCDQGWTGTECQTVCDASAATKCGSDCHCQNDLDCGTITCFGSCDPGWSGTDCQRGNSGATTSPTTCQPGKYGTNCGLNCPCQNYQSNACDRTSGACSGQCRDGYYGTSCVACPCQNSLSNLCDKDSGNCLGSCRDGFWGSKCEQTCTCTNRQSAACEKSNGQCTSPCNNDGTEPDCQPTSACDANAATKCGSDCHCKNDLDCGTTTCFGSCDAGWKGTDCQRVCDANTATKCGSDCHCEFDNYCGTTTCYSLCDPGWKGTDCQRVCDASAATKCGTDCHCQNDLDCGTTTCFGSCDPGWKGTDCQTADSGTTLPPPCQTGKYGQYCDLDCSCPNHKSNACEKSTGVCSDECKDGYYGGSCIACSCQNFLSNTCHKTTGDCAGECKDGFYGRSCVACSCPNFLSNTCDKTTGVCSGECTDGFYGSGCVDECPCQNYQSNTCNKTTGACTGSCQDGYWETNCETRCSCPNRQTAGCDRTSGVCTGQCNPGLTGANCESGRSVFRVCDSMRELRNECNIDCELIGSADLLTFTLLRKYMATASQMLSVNDQELHWIVKHLGHSLTVHDQYYRVMSSTLERAKIAKLLVLADQGMLGKYKGQSLEQLNFDADTKLEESQSEEMLDDSDTSDDDSLGSEGKNKVPVQRRSGSTASPIAGTEKPPEMNIVYPVLGGVLGLVAIVILVVVVGFIVRRRRNGEHTHNLEGGNKPIIAKKPKKKDKRLKRGVVNSIRLSRDINLPELIDIVHSLDADPKFTDEEFESIPGGVAKPCETAYLPQHAHKCRFKGIVPYDHSRVVLEPGDSDPYSDFINASYINGYSVDKKYVAAQGPTTFIMNDFWRMIWQVNTDVILMLTKLKEGNKKKCDQYWPDSGSVTYGHITVGLLANQQFDDFCVRTLTVRAEGKVRTIKQFHFTHWGDHDAPDDTSGIISVMSRVREAKDEDKGPIVVHCSAGVGRTGTYIALDILLERGKAHGEVDLPKCVIEIRTQRANLIQTPGQYAFLHRALRDAWVGMDSILTPTELHFSSYMGASTSTNQNKAELEFEGLSYLEKIPKSDDFNDANVSKNRNKNRDLDNLAPDCSRVYLSTYIAGRTDYINAVYLPGYKDKFAYVSTQTPLPDTVIDFWRLVHELRASTIIMLNADEMEADGIYWPADDESLTTGPFEIHHQWTDSDGDTLVRQFGLMYTKDNKEAPQIVRQLSPNLWKPDENVPSTKEGVINLFNAVSQWQRQHDNRPIIVHCRNGVERTVLLCACFSVLEKLKAEQIISVLYTVKTMRKHRPGAVATFDQYQFIYQILGQYMEAFDTYSNFFP